MTSERPTRVRWMILGLACFTSWILYLHRYAWGVIKTDVGKEFNLSKVQLGWLDSAFSTGYALCQVPVGLAGDLWGTGFTLPIIIGTWSLALGLLVLGAGVWSFMSLRFLFGCTQAGTYPNLGRVTRSWYPLSQRTMMQGLIATFSGRLGAAFSGIIIASLMMGVLKLSWREVLLILAGVGIVFAFVFGGLFRSSPRVHPWTNDAERKLIEAEEPPDTGRVTVRFDRRKAVMISFGFLLLHIFLSAFADQLFVYWIFSFLEEAKGQSKKELGFFGSLPLFGGAVGGLVAGFLIDRVLRRTKNRRLSRSLFGFVGKIIAAIFVIISLQFENGRVMMLIVMVGKFFTDWSQPAVWATITDISGRAAGRIFGFVNMAGSIGGILAGPILGSIIQHYGWNALFWTIAVIYALSAICWIFIDSTKPVVLEETENG